MRVKSLILAAVMATALAGCSTIGNMRIFSDDYGPRTDAGYQLPRIPISKVPRKYHRQIVSFETNEKPGTIIVDTNEKFLYYVMGGGEAMRYGIGVGRQGFSWTGDATIKVKQEWPKWFPPPEMVERDPKAAPYAKGMDGGLDNPLGARALYLYQGNKDTLYRLHGTNEPASIGHAVSSGCIRLLNQDIIDLYNRVPLETKVIVLGGPETLPPSGDGALYPPVAVGPSSPAQPI